MCTVYPTKYFKLIVVPYILSLLQYFINKLGHRMWHMSIRNITTTIKFNGHRFGYNLNLVSLYSVRNWYFCFTEYFCFTDHSNNSCSNVLIFVLRMFHLDDPNKHVRYWQSLVSNCKNVSWRNLQCQSCQPRNYTWNPTTNGSKADNHG